MYNVLQYCFDRQEQGLAISKECLLSRRLYDSLAAGRQGHLVVNEQSMVNHGVTYVFAVQE